MNGVTVDVIFSAIPYVENSGLNKAQIPIWVPVHPKPELGSENNALNALITGILMITNSPVFALKEDEYS